MRLTMKLFTTLLTLVFKFGITSIQSSEKRTNILLENIVNIIQEAKGKEIISLDLRKINTAICQYFIICTGTSSTHVKSIENKIKKMISQKLSEKPYSTSAN